MRTFIIVALVAGLTLSLTTTVRADEEGYLGIMLKKATEGIEIVGVGADSPADKGGLKKGDVIKKLNGKEDQTGRRNQDPSRPRRQGAGTQSESREEGRSMIGLHAGRGGCSQILWGAPVPALLCRVAPDALPGPQRIR